MALTAINEQYLNMLQTLQPPKYNVENNNYETPIPSFIDENEEY